MLLIEGEHMKLRYRSLAAAVIGASTVLVALWLSRSVIWFASREASTATILLLVFGSAALMARRGRLAEAVGLLAGAGAAWAVSEVNPLSLCQSDMLYRPCTASEVAWMALPALMLGIAGLVLLFYDLIGTRLSR
jgi:hypothetical protein